jgi:uncharacterized protein
MSDELLERYIRQLIDAHRSNEVTVAWQGGEPTIMGIDFFRRAIAYQEKYRRPGMRFENTIQTNGTLLTDEWCEFLKSHDYLVGISIDGPRDLHDVHRVDKGGRGTFDRVMRGLRLLQKHGVEYNVLATVNASNADRPLEVYRFLRDDAGTAWIQFIPVVDRDGDAVLEDSVHPEQWGAFLCSIYDEWIRHDVGTVFVSIFEATARNFFGLPSGTCVFDATCGSGLALLHNGDVYSCDHFVEPAYLIGNLNERPLVDLVNSDFQRDFGNDKQASLPSYCLDCDVRFACHGECPKNRFVTTPDGEAGLNYLCAGYKAFFHHVSPTMSLLVGLLRQNRPAQAIMEVVRTIDQRSFAHAGRNDSCPCGSGVKYKKCHGAR